MKVVALNDLSTCPVGVHIHATPDTTVAVMPLSVSTAAVHLGHTATIYCDPHALAAAITAAAVQAGIPAPQPQPTASEGAAHE